MEGRQVNQFTSCPKCGVNLYSWEDCCPYCQSDDTVKNKGRDLSEKVVLFCLFAAAAIFIYCVMGGQR